MTLDDIVRMGRGAIAANTPRQPQGADYMQRLFDVGYGSRVRPIGQGGSLTPMSHDEALKNLFGIGDGGHPQTPPPLFQPAPPVPQYFGNDWSGMRRNIGMPYGGGMGAAGGMAGGMLGQPQRSLYGGGPGLGGAGGTLGSLLGMFGGGYRG